MTVKRIVDWFIYLILGVWFGAEILFGSTIKTFFGVETQKVNDMLATVLLVMLMIQIVVFQKYTRKEMLFLSIMTGPILLATVTSGYHIILSTWLFIIAAKNISLDKAILISYIVEIIAFAIIFYLYFMGYIDEYTMYRGNILRRSLGFSHPNQLGIRIFQLVICRCYLRRTHMNISDLLVVIISVVVVNVLANSKTAYYALIILAGVLCLNSVSYYTGKGKAMVAKIMLYGSFLSVAVSLFFSFIDVRRYSYLIKLDDFMSHRFSNCYRLLKFYGLSLWGKNIQLHVKRHIIGREYHFWLDNAYMAILLRYGLLVFCIFVGVYLYTMMLLFQKGQYELVEIMGIYAVYGIMENSFFSLSQNLFLLVLSLSIYGEHLISNRLIVKLKIKTYV